MFLQHRLYHSISLVFIIIVHSICVPDNSVICVMRCMVAVSKKKKKKKKRRTQIKEEDEMNGEL